MEFVKQIDVIDSDLLWQSVETFISHNLLWDYNQLSEVPLEASFVIKAVTTFCSH